MDIMTKNLGRKFGEQWAVQGLNLSVPPKSIYGFLGPNGSGKTTTIRMLLGLARPSSGTARILGQDIGTDIALDKIGYLPDVPSFYPWMRGEEFLLLVGDLFGIPRQQLRKRSHHLLELVGLQGVKTKISAYSRGMKQRLGLAQAMINEPHLIFMDEPTSALDPQGRKEVLETIQAISSQCTVFFSTHVLSDVERVCNRVGVLRQGRLITEASMDELRTSFAQKMLAITVTGPAEDLVADIQHQDWVQTVEEKDNQLLISAVDLEMAQRELPRLVAKHQLGLQRLTPVEMTLEDIFLRLVNSND